MNTIRAINTDYLRPSRTIETVLISNSKFEKVFFIYNYEGNSFRLFFSHSALIDFFENNNSKCYFHFATDDELDFFLRNINLSN